MRLPNAIGLIGVALGIGLAGCGGGNDQSPAANNPPLVAGRTAVVSPAQTTTLSGIGATLPLAINNSAVTVSMNALNTDGSVPKVTFYNPSNTFHLGPLDMLASTSEANVWSYHLTMSSDRIFHDMIIAVATVRGTGGVQTTVPIAVFYYDGRGLQ